MNPATGRTGVDKTDAILGTSSGFSTRSSEVYMVCLDHRLRLIPGTSGCERCIVRKEIEREQNSKLEAEIDRRLAERRS